MWPTRNIGGVGGASGDGSGNSDPRGAVGGGRSAPSLTADSMDIDASASTSSSTAPAIPMIDAYSSPSFLLREGDVFKTYFLSKSELSRNQSTLRAMIAAGRSVDVVTFVSTTLSRVELQTPDAFSERTHALTVIERSGDGEAIGVLNGDGSLTMPYGEIESRQGGDDGGGIGKASFSLHLTSGQHDRLMYSLTKYSQYNLKVKISNLFGKGFNLRDYAINPDKGQIYKVVLRIGAGGVIQDVESSGKFGRDPEPELMQTDRRLLSQVLKRKADTRLDEPPLAKRRRFLND